MPEPTHIDLLIHGAYLVAFDAAGTELRDAAIAIAGNSIAWIGSAAEAAARFMAKDTLDASGLIAICQVELKLLLLQIIKTIGCKSCAQSQLLVK